MCRPVDTVSKILVMQLFPPRERFRKRFLEEKDYCDHSSPLEGFSYIRWRDEGSIIMRDMLVGLI